jgi:hypothetical protein
MANALAQLLMPKKLSPAEAAGVLAPNQAPDLTGYFDQLNTSRNPVDIPGIDQEAAMQNVRDKNAADAENEALIDQNPDVSAMRDKELQDKIQIANAQPGGLNVENAKIAGAKAQEQTKQDQLMKLLQPQGTPQNEDRAPFKMSINANMEPTFAPNPMPALIQRAHGQLSEAHDQHLEALAEAERLWPGINAAAQQADKGAAPGMSDSLGRWLGSATGIGAPKYGGPGDAASLASEMLRYKAHQDTPLSNFVQKASFGNIEQMAGQLPGVRGLATVAGLFKQHQDALGSANPGTPLANVQRLRHLIDSEESATHEMETEH